MTEPKRTEVKAPAPANVPSVEPSQTSGLIVPTTGTQQARPCGRKVTEPKRTEVEAPAPANAPLVERAQSSASALPSTEPQRDRLGSEKAEMKEAEWDDLFGWALVSEPGNCV